jgi:WD repeat-containing protein 61
MPVRSLAWLPDSETLLTACDDGYVSLFDAEHGALIEELKGHSSWVLSVAAAPDGGCFATGGADAAVRVWDVATRTCSQVLAAEHSDLVWAVAFSPDGGRLASAADDKAVALYSVS